MELRRATIDDADALLAWRNDDETRRASFSQGVVSRGEHLAWLAARLAPMHDESVWMITDSNGDVGSARICVTGDDFAQISITIAPTCRDKGYGRQAILLLAQKVRHMHRTPVAFVRQENARSLAVFRAAGFHLKRSDDGRMELWHKC
jgi:RimJ/RimL family protein N-acetyltransferase